MIATSRGTRSLMMCALLSLSACGDGAPEPKPSPPQPTVEAPKATLRGQLAPTPGTPMNGPVRLALAWYPALLSEQSGPVSGPRGIVTEDMAYFGSFPVNYTFNVKSAPPAEALVELGEGMQGRGAVGILLAYSDRNGNATLDTIPADGEPVDRVLGASLAWTQPPAFMVIYLESTQAPATGLKQGFNLVRITDNLTSTVVPLTTPIPVALQDDTLLDAFVCEAAWDDTAEQAPCGLGDEMPVESTLELMGELLIQGTGADVSLEVRRDALPVEDAQVSIGDRAATYDAASGRYTLHLDNASALLDSGLVTVSARQGDEETVRTLVVPTNFRVTAPTAPMSYSPGADIRAVWTEAQGASHYEVAVVADDQVLASEVTENRWQTLIPAAYEGAATLRVSAVSMEEVNAGFVVRTVLEVPLSFTGCDRVTEGSQLTVDGEFSRYPSNVYGWETSEVRAEVKDHGVHVTDAKVTIAGWDVPYVKEEGAFHNGIIAMGPGSLGDTLQLRVMRGNEVLCRTLQVPGAFELTLPGEASRPSGSPLSAHWTRSEGAVRYDLWLGASPSSPLYSASTNELEYTFEQVDYVGELRMRFSAVAVPVHNDTLGWVEVKRVIPAGATFTAR
ncbi:hypothetical protein ACLESD_30140 [Pyxidicoccus sp. 3LFB2]